MEDIVKKKTLTGFIWKFLERFGAQVVSFIVSIVLARLLTPNDFGTVSIIMIVISFLNVFVDAGFGLSLVQKKNADVVDFSTITWFSGMASIVFYLILFFVAPYIAKIYDIPQLTILIRVMGIRLFLSGYNSVQQAYIQKRMEFKKFFFVTSIGTIISAFVGIIMAYKGFGTWALIAQYLTNTVCDTILLSVFSRLKIKFTFSGKRLKALLKVSLPFLFSAIIGVVYSQLQSIVIGLKYSPADLAQYNRAISIPSLIGSNIVTILGSVIFPMLVTIQDDRTQMREVIQKYFRVSTYIIMPIYIGLSVTSASLIKIIYGEKWLECIPYMQIICLSLILDPLTSGCNEIYKSLGRSDIMLYADIIKKVCYTIIIIICMNYGVWWIAFAQIPINIVAVIVNTFPTKKLINYNIFQQILDILPNLIISLVMGLVVYYIGIIKINIYALLTIQVLAGIIIYLGLSFLFKNESMKIFLKTIKMFKKK